MSELPEMRAFEALAKHERLADLVAIVRALVLPAAQARKADWMAPDEVKALAKERKLEPGAPLAPEPGPPEPGPPEPGPPEPGPNEPPAEGDARAATSAEATTAPTPPVAEAPSAVPAPDPIVADVLRMLCEGPKSADDRALARALWAHAVAETRPKTAEDEDRVAADSLWLAAHTPFDATTLLDRALGEEAEGLWVAIASRIKKLDRDAQGRVEALLGAAAIAGSESPAARAQAGKLSAEVQDPGLARLLGRDAPPVAAELTGEVQYAPRGWLASGLLAVSGALCVLHVSRLAARAALAYRRPATVTVSTSGVRVRWQTQVLGRTLKERDVVVAREGLATVAREVRYPRAAFYAGLFFLAAGSFIGVRTLADGVRAASPTLLLVGFAVIATGILLDFALGSLAPGFSGRCRVFVVPARGRALCLANVDAERADAALGRLSVSR